MQTTEKVMDHIIELENSDKNYIQFNEVQMEKVRKAKRQLNSNEIGNEIINIIEKNIKPLGIKEKAIIIEWLNNKNIISVSQKDWLYFFVSENLVKERNEDRRNFNAEKRNKNYIAAYLFTGIVLLSQAIVDFLTAIGFFTFEETPVYIVTVVFFLVYLLLTLRYLSIFKTLK